MRPVRLLVLALVALLCRGALAGTIIPQQLILYKDGAHPALQQVQAKWLPPDAAYTAITLPAQFDVLLANGAQIQSAQVQVVWQANSPGFNTGAGIFLCPAQPQAGVELTGCSYLAYFAANDSGPASYTPGCVSNPGGPFPCRADVTAALRAALAAGTPNLYYVGAAYGNGTTGPIIYDLEVIINWLVP